MPLGHVHIAIGIYNFAYNFKANIIHFHNSDFKTTTICLWKLTFNSEISLLNY